MVIVISSVEQRLNQKAIHYESQFHTILRCFMLTRILNNNQ
ncbi:hypothetical protein HMPREF0693_1591 [Proteus mirabilis ATCC 29906]|nr:hypothetical protein HMPREF0693_1591 [Proteus mirabilis ATCC 29906]